MTDFQKLKNTNGEKEMEKFYKLACLLCLFLVASGTLWAQNMERYITLTVKSGAQIKLGFYAADASTQILIKSGEDVLEPAFGEATNAKDYLTKTVTPTTDKITVYGDLQGFDCKKNGENITELEANNTELTDLKCYQNKIAKLDVSKCAKLEVLLCYENELEELDVTHNLELLNLGCKNNKISKLDVTKNTKLEKLLIRDNNISKLDISQNKKLFWLYCSSNPLSTQELDNIYCNLPDRVSEDKIGLIGALFNDKDTRSDVVLATNKANASNKNWRVCYNNDKPIPDTKGKYVCGSNPGGGQPSDPEALVETATLAGISIAPNPFTTQLKIRNDEALNARYELLNTLGIVMRAGALQGTETTLNTADLKVGAYLLRIVSDNKSQTLHVVKE